MKIIIRIAMRQSEDYKSSRLTIMLTVFLRSDLICQSVKCTQKSKLGIVCLFLKNTSSQTSEEQFIPTFTLWRWCHCTRNGFNLTFVIFCGDKMKLVDRSGTEDSDVNDITILLKYRFKKSRNMAMKETYCLEDLAHHLTRVHIAWTIFIYDN